MAPYKKPFKKSFKKTSYKKKSYTKSNKKNLRTFIKKVISSVAENKTTQAYQPNYPIYNKSHANFSLSMFPVCPYSTSLQIDQGVSQSQRVGNIIKIKKLIFDATVYPRPYNATTNISPQPYIVKFWFYIERTSPTALVAPDNTFLQLGGSNVGLQGNLVDVSAPNNIDKWRIFATKTVKVGYASNNGTGNSASNQSYNNNDFKFNTRFKMNLTKHLVKTVKYNDNSSVPTTRGLFCIAEAIDASGSTTGASTIPVEMFYTLNLQFEDI